MSKPPERQYLAIKGSICSSITSGADVYHQAATDLGFAPRLATALAQRIWERMIEAILDGKAIRVPGIGTFYLRHSQPARVNSKTQNGGRVSGLSRMRVFIEFMPSVKVLGLARAKWEMSPVQWRKETCTYYDADGNVLPFDISTTRNSVPYYIKGQRKEEVPGIVPPKRRVRKKRFILPKKDAPGG